MKDLSSIKIFVMDCDGVLTNGTITYSADKEGINFFIESKQFSVMDGLIIDMVRQSDLMLAVITGRKSQVLTERCRELGIDLVFQGIKNKVIILEDLLRRYSLDWSNVAYMGDDWNDYPVIEKAYFTFAPAQSFPAFKKKVDYVTSRKGGEGAIREAIEVLLNNQGIFDSTLEKYLDYLKTKGA